MSADEDEEEEYDPKPVDDEIEKYLREIDDDAMAREIADTIDYDEDYTRRRANAMEEDGRIGRRRGNRVVGYDLPGGGDPVVITNRELAIDIIRASAPSPTDDLSDMALDDLRDFIEANIAEDRVPLNWKVRYFHDEEVHGDWSLAET